MVHLPPSGVLCHEVETTTKFLFMENIVKSDFVKAICVETHNDTIVNDKEMPLASAGMMCENLKRERS